jgi:hypothetical protein
LDVLNSLSREVVDGELRYRLSEPWHGEDEGGDADAKDRRLVERSFGGGGDARFVSEKTL